MSYQDQTRGHTFDGIEEFDNRLPNWWLWTFYGACIFSVFYWIHYHTLKTGPLSYQEYLIEKAEAAKAEEAIPFKDEDLIKMAADPAEVAKGKGLFDANCVACHKPDGGGLIGPNLTDKFWIHGGSPGDIIATITNGVPAKGMQAWKQQLGFKGVRSVAAYVWTLRNTNVEGGKAAEGKPVDGD